MSLETLPIAAPFLRHEVGGTFTLSLNNTYRTKKSDVELGLAWLERYLKDNGNVKLLVKLGYDLDYDSVEFFSSLLQDVKPILRYAQTVQLSFTHDRDPPTVEATPAVWQALQDISKVFRRHKVQLHLVMEEHSMESTAERFFAIGICKAVREKLSEFVKVLRFVDDGLFTQARELQWENNEEMKLRELHEFFLKLPSEFPHLQEAIGKFPIFARIGGKMVEVDNMGYKLYHITRMRVPEGTIIDERPHTAGTKDTRLRGEKVGFAKRIRTI